VQLYHRQQQQQQDLQELLFGAKPPLSEMQLSLHPMFQALAYQNLKVPAANTAK
jgi:hypothetical protein